MDRQRQQKGSKRQAATWGHMIWVEQSLGSGLWQLVRVTSCSLQPEEHGHKTGLWLIWRHWQSSCSNGWVVTWLNHLTFHCWLGFNSHEGSICKVLYILHIRCTHIYIEWLMQIALAIFPTFPEDIQVQIHDVSRGNRVQSPAGGVSCRIYIISFCWVDILATSVINQINDFHISLTSSIERPPACFTFCAMVACMSFSQQLTYLSAVILLH